jgi:hypothetical protein
MGFLSHGNSLDFSSLRRQLESAYKSTSGPMNVDLSTLSLSVRTIHVFAQAGIHHETVVHLIATIVSPFSHRLGTCELIRIFHSAALLNEHLENEVLGALREEISSPERMSDLEGVDDLRTICIVLESMQRLNFRHVGLFQICADNILFLKSALNVDSIQLILNVSDRLQLRHKALLDSIILILPIVPCSDEELQSIVHILLKLEAGSADDRKYLRNLVSFRLASIVD